MLFGFPPESAFGFAGIPTNKCAVEEPLGRAMTL
jgi:hypothetical protein